MARNLAADGAEGADGIRAFLFECRKTKASPLYVAFRRAFPRLWTAYFEPLFKTAGYAPLYDLVTQAFRGFRLFDLFTEEEAAWPSSSKPSRISKARAGTTAASSSTWPRTKPRAIPA